MKAHIGLDSATGLIHSASVTAANEHDSKQLSYLLRGNETRLYGDSACRSQQETLKGIAPPAKNLTNKRACRNIPASEKDKQVNRTKSQTRVKVKHPFLTLKRIWGFGDLGICKGTLSGSGQECKPYICDAGPDQY